MRLFVAFVVVASALSGCASSGVSRSSYLDRAETAIGRQEWETAYRFVEDDLISNQPDTKQRAMALIQSHPKLLESAAQTFSPKNISATIALFAQVGSRDSGEERAIDSERRRLAMYRVVAAPTEYEIAKATINSFAVAIDARRLDEAKRSEEKEVEREKTEKLRKLQLEDERRKSDEKIRMQAEELLRAERSAFVLCLNKAACDKAFSLTQIYINQTSDMKIQLATDAIVETHNPTEDGKLALKAIRIPGKGSSALITLVATCRNEKGFHSESCRLGKLSAYLGFPSFVDRLLKE